ncbi:iron-sulfur cluster repair di-iron protein [Reichenbachiella ulvae]|uniref:Iron-sulfur cluster repair di-iron protein n=1 Tax=Reichenbachiella ulvae TaxID=2980104 RepID=A0ABT3CYE1_9BACT|nr:iron-sulfur cluster repair di-iron protein [Reichenbachiella ulvae]MCV9388228.1 iron-sulfur cluster repair di-iron protein [Reichenbachiella ulvae]
MENLAKTKVGKIVASNFRTSTVFTAHQIDFCCGGGITLEEACKDKNQDLQQVIEELEASFAIRDQKEYAQLPLDQLIDEIIDVHHAYVERTTIPLLTYLNKLCRVHGERHPELNSIYELFTETAGALTQHMKKEELILFPFVKKMLAVSKEGGELPEAVFGHIDNPITMMEHEHDTEGKRLKEIAEISKNYSCPPDGCQTYKVTYAMLEEFEQDLHKHIHLENNILFPAAKELYQRLTKS